MANHIGRKSQGRVTNPPSRMCKWNMLNHPSHHLCPITETNLFRVSSLNVTTNITLDNQQHGGTFRYVG